MGTDMNTHETADIREYGRKGIDQAALLILASQTSFNAGWRRARNNSCSSSNLRIASRWSICLAL